MTAASSPAGASTRDPIDVAAIKADFPLLSAPRDEPLVYLDSAATSQKPRQVLDAMTCFYETTNANVARGVYEIAERATNEMEGARSRVARFIGATSAQGLAAMTAADSTYLNGLPALRIWLDGELAVTVQLRVDHGLVTELYFVRNPDKLTRLEGEALPISR